MDKNMKNSMIILSALLLSSCGLLTGTHQKIFFDSTYDGADIHYRGKYLCTTPCEAKVRKSSQMQTVSCKKDGYVGKVVKLYPRSRVLTDMEKYLVLPYIIDAAADTLSIYDPNQFCTLYLPDEFENERNGKNHKNKIIINNY